MEEPAMVEESIHLPPPTEVSPTQKIHATGFHPQLPIILNPGISEASRVSLRKGFLSTFGLLLAGWFVGNLIILALLGSTAVGVVGASGLVKVPVLTNYLFGKEQPNFTPAESFALDDAKLKLEEVTNLKKGQSLKSVEFSESEVNALLNNQINNSTTFPIANQKLELETDRFIFSGNLLDTNAPVLIIGSLQASNLKAHISITQAKFGKIEIPTFLSGRILESSFSKIGLSISGSSVPAQSLKVSEGKLTFQEVVNLDQ